MTRHFRPSLELTNIYLYRDPVDFRKQVACLAAIVEHVLGQKPFDGGLYAFTNRQRNKIKCLQWEVCKHFHTSHYERFRSMELIAENFYRLANRWLLN